MTTRQMAGCFPMPYTEEQEQLALAELGTERDPEARAGLVEHNLWLVVSIAGKYAGKSNSVEELVSIGTIGLIKAVHTYSPARETRLAAYTSRCIENEIFMHLRKSLHAPRMLSFNELAGTGTDGAVRPLSELLNTDDSTYLEERKREHNRRLVNAAISRLSEQEQQVIHLRFGFFPGDGRQRSQREVAVFFGFSQSYLSRVERRALKKLKNYLQDARYLP